MIGLLLQVPAAPALEEISLWSLLVRGGWVMVPIGLLLLAGLFVFIERLLAISRAQQVPKGLLPEVQAAIQSQDLPRALQDAKRSNSPYGRLVAKGVSRIGSPLADINSSLESEANLEIAHLEKRLSLLATVAGAAPMFGFLGTVLGIIKVFYGVSTAGNITIGAIAGGMYEKMVASAAGLFVGIFAYLAYNLLIGMIEGVTRKLQATAVEFLDILHQPA
jgi:biopolymer transport protein ExbB